MNRREGLICYVLGFCTLIGALIVKAAESRNGNWTIQRADKVGEVDLALIEHHHGGNSNHESTIRVSELKGLDLSRLENRMCTSRLRGMQDDSNAKGL